MTELVIAILMTLGISFGTTQEGKIKMDSASKAKTEASREYQEKFGTKSLDDIVVVPDVDPIEHE